MPRVRRAFALLLLIMALAPGTWVRGAPPRPPDTFELAIHELPLPSKADLAPHLGAFRLKGIWQLESRHPEFGGFSALVMPIEGELLAFSDKGFMLAFSAPDRTRSSAVRFGPVLATYSDRKQHRDIEAATFDQADGMLWLALENSNSIIRFRRSAAGGLHQPKQVAPGQMAGWGANSGPETLVRLGDGRFLALREGFDGTFEDRRHQALLFASDPVENPGGMELTMIGPEGFSPTDAAQLPDGRVLVLMRRLVWPFPARFAGRLAIGDPVRIRPGEPWQVTQVARLPSALPVDNFEGMAIEPRADGSVSVWLISDDNDAAFQRTLLWKLQLDPEDLPTPRNNGARPQRTP